MCGLCLPHCPTYGLTRQEGDSPRGRISLMQALASAQLPADDRVTAHLDGCLGCRACEAMCPSGVPFGRLLDESRALLREMREDHPKLPALARPLLRSDRIGRTAAALLHVYQRSGVHGTLSRALDQGRLGRALSLLPPGAAPAMPAGRHKPEGESRGRVRLFTGCTGAAFEGGALAAARDLLLALGHEVEIPVSQDCCGALDLHAGNPTAARTRAARNLAAFGETDTPVIALNSGCRTQLRGYAQLLPGEATGAFANRVRDLCGFLLDQDLEALTFDSRPAAVAVHLPCTLRNVLKEHGAMLALLRRLPGTEVVELEGNAYCCGAAGTHMITHPQAADALLAPKIEAVRRLDPQAVITANIGCSLHFQAGLRQAGIDIPVVTPVEWVFGRLKVEG
jgi:glycolate oxidase iron-sulfur subunit